jgi:alpha-D-ribose 1-methylphosphonate 5-phosphate C-P lyase
VPPYTDVESLGFEDHPFEPQRFDQPCAICGSTGVYLDEVITNDKGESMFVCSDTDHCERTAAVLTGAGPAGAGVAGAGVAGAGAADTEEVIA